MTLYVRTPRRLGDGRPADHVAPLQDHDPLAGLGQQPGGDQAVVAPTDDDRRRSRSPSPWPATVPSARDPPRRQEPGAARGRGPRRQRRTRARRLRACCEACSPGGGRADRGRDRRRSSPASRSTRSVRGDRDEFRYEMLNRSAACQAAVGAPGDPRGDRAAARRRLPRDRQHGVAQPARRSRGGPWHCDAGPHVPRPEDVPWDDRIPYPVFAIGAHLLLRDCARRRRPDRGRAGQPPLGPARAVRPARDPELTYDGRPPVLLEATRATSRCSSRTPGTAACRRPGGRGR